MERRVLREATRGAWPHGLVGHDVDSRRCVAEVRSEKGLLAVVLDAGPVPAVLWGKQRPPLRCPAPPTWRPLTEGVEETVMN